MSEYLDHLSKDDAMVSSTLSSVLKEQTTMVSEAVEKMSAQFACGGSQITTDDVQDVTFDASGIEISFFAGYATALKSQKLYRNKCNVSCGGIETDGICSKWSAVKVSSTSFMVSLKFQDSL
jgi:hypothetical protein